MAKKIHIERSLIVEITFGAVTQFFLVLHSEFLITSANLDAKFDSTSDPENRNKMVCFGVWDIVVYVSRVIGICRWSVLASSTQIMPLYTEKNQQSGWENVNGLDKALICTDNRNNEIF